MPNRRKDRNRGRRSTALRTGLLLAGLVLSGCGALGPPPRTPTRPEGAAGEASSGALTDDHSDPPSPPPGDAAACVAVGGPASSEHLRMQDLINDYRRRSGLSTLAYSLTLQEAADRFAERMYRENFFDHTAPDGSGPGERALEAGFCNRFVGENIAYGLNLLGSADEAMQGFIDSPAHNENMLRPDWDYVGVGFLHRAGFGTDEFWWVQLFGRDTGQ